MLNASREKFCTSSRKHGATCKQRDCLWDAIFGERPLAPATQQSGKSINYDKASKGSNEALKKPSHLLVQLAGQIEELLRRIPQKIPRTRDEVQVRLEGDGEEEDEGDLRRHVRRSAVLRVGRSARNHAQTHSVLATEAPHLHARKRP